MRRIGGSNHRAHIAHLSAPPLVPTCTLQGATVLIIANRTLVSAGAWQRSSKTTGVRPRSRTLQSVQAALLDAYEAQVSLREATNTFNTKKAHFDRAYQLYPETIEAYRIYCKDLGS